MLIGVNELGAESRVSVYIIYATTNSRKTMDVYIKSKA